MTEQPETEAGAGEPGSPGRFPQDVEPLPTLGINGSAVSGSVAAAGQVNGVDPYVAPAPPDEPPGTLAAFGWGDPVAAERLGQPPQPVPDPPVRETRRRRWIIAAVAGAVFVGGAAVAAAYGPTAYDILREKDTTLTAPDQAAGLRLDDSQQAMDTADYLRTALAADLGLRSGLGAVYADPAASSRSIIIVGGTGLMRSPEKDLGRAFDLFADGGSQVSGVHDVDPGALGGVMRCGTLSSTGGDMAVCGWADHGALAIAMFPGRTADESAPVLRDLRSAIQHRD